MFSLLSSWETLIWFTSCHSLRYWGRRITLNARRESCDLRIHSLWYLPNSNSLVDQGSYWLCHDVHRVLALFLSNCAVTTTSWWAWSPYSLRIAPYCFQLLDNGILYPKLKPLLKNAKPILFVLMAITHKIKSRYSPLNHNTRLPMAHQSHAVSGRSFRTIAHSWQ